MVVSEPSLYILATHHKFDELIARLSNKNNDEQSLSLDWCDMHGNTVLHILCRQTELPRKAIAAVVEKKPDLVGQMNHAFWTPLHLACERRHHPAVVPSARAVAARVALPEEQEERPEIPAREGTRLSSHGDILLLLLRACPQAVSQRRESGFARDTPLDMVCCAASPLPDLQVVREMLRIDPALAMPSTQQFNSNSNSMKDNLKVLWKHKLTKHMELLLLTALVGRVVVDEEDASQFLLHAACLQRVPRDYLEELILDEHRRNHLLLPDPQNGNLPLHYAVSQRHTGQPFCEFLVKALVQHAPEAVEVRNKKGRYPLHCALDHEDGNNQPFLKNAKLLKLLCRPSTLSAVDPVTELYPLHMATRYANLSRAHFSTLYEVLLAAPQVVQTGIPETL
jgi:ankyrin repeat protein